MKTSNEFTKSKIEDFDFTKSFEDLSISLTYSLNIKSIVANAPLSDNNEIHSTTFFKVPNLKCLNCATDMCYYKSRETEKEKLIIKCNLCGLSSAPNAKGFLLCRNCDFSLCHKCRTCSNGHYLKKIYDFNIEKLPTFIKKNFVGTIDELKCHLCELPSLEMNRFSNGYNPFYMCLTCVYLMCKKCMCKTKGINL